MKALFFSEHGTAENLSYGDVTLGDLKEGWARVAVKAVGLNHLDIWIRRGWPGLQLDFPHITGADVCGEVREVNGRSESIHVGDRVIVFPGIVEGTDEFIQRGEPSVSPHYQVLGEHLRGGLAEYVDVPIRNLLTLRQSISDEQAAARNLVLTTTWRMLFCRGNLQPDESVLVVGSGGGVNVASIQIAAAHGARVIVLAGSKEKCEKAREIGADAAICYADYPDWHREVMRNTNGAGVDLVVDNVGEASFMKSLKSLKRGGRLLTVGNTTGYQVKIDNRLVFGKQLSIIGSTMGSWNDWINALNFYDKQDLSLPLDGVYPLSEGKQQLERMEQGEHFGKIILVP